MKQTFLYLILIFAIALFASCSEEVLSPEQEFNRIYAADELVQSVDILIKPNESGFLVLTNVKNRSQTNSDICILDIDVDGSLNTKIPILTDFYDEATAFTTYNSEIFISGSRRTDANSSSFESFVIKCNEVGIPIPNTAESDSVGFSANFKIIDATASLKINDILVKDGNLVLTGGVNYEQGQNAVDEIFLIYGLSEINFSNEDNLTNPRVNFQSSLELFDEGKFLIEDNVFNFAVFLENTLPNDQNQEVEPSRNVGLRMNSNYNLPTTEFNNFGSSRDEILGAASRGNFGEEFFFGGSLLDSDSLFITKAFRNTSGQIENYTENRLAFAGYGSNITAICQLDDARVLVATSQENENGETSTFANLLQFRASPDLIDREPIILQNNNFQRITKIIKGSNNEVFVLSDIEFSNDASAVGLTKVLF